VKYSSHSVSRAGRGIGPGVKSARELPGRSQVSRYIYSGNKCC
jgi:hypothetical protein